MNKIEVVNEELVTKNVDSSILLKELPKNDSYEAKKIVLEIVSDTKLEIAYEGENKLEFLITINPKVSFELFEYQHSKKAKVFYEYHLKEKGEAVIKKYVHAEVREMEVVYLDEPEASFNSTLKGRNEGNSKYDFLVYHHAEKTNSHLKNHFVNENGKMILTVTGEVLKGKFGCVLNQENRIINLTDELCEIKPILLIDENDVTANHSALVGGFKDSEIFYLTSRGINKEDALKLLIRGFLMNLQLEEEQKKKIELDLKKWR